MASFVGHKVSFKLTGLTITEVNAVHNICLREKARMAVCDFFHHSEQRRLIRGMPALVAMRSHRQTAGGLVPFFKEHSHIFRRLSLSITCCGFTRLSLEILSYDYFWSSCLPLCRFLLPWGYSYNVNKEEPFEPSFPADEIGVEPTVFHEALFDYSGQPI